jgi:hypothetical protein
MESESEEVEEMEGEDEQAPGNDGEAGTLAWSPSVREVLTVEVVVLEGGCGW